MYFADKVKSDEAYRYDWLQVNTVIPKTPGQHLNESHFSQQKVYKIKYLPFERLLWTNRFIFIYLTDHVTL